MAIREDIFAWAEQALVEQEGGEVRRMPSTDPRIYPARHIFDGGHRLLEQGAFETRYELSLRVEGYVEAADGPEAHAEMHALYAATVQALLADPPAGGVAETIDEGDLNIIVAPLGGKSRLCFTLDFTITFAARRGDPADPA